MKLYRIVNNQLEALPHDHESVEYAELMSVKVINEMTCKEMLEMGQLVLVARYWVVPERITVKGDEIEDSADMVWETTETEHTNRIEYRVRALRDSEEMKSSLHVEIKRGYAQTVPDRPRTVHTKYGDMPIDNLEERFPRPGRREYWMVSDKPFSDEQLADKDNYERRIESDGRVVWLELVQASQIAQRE